MRDPIAVSDLLPLGEGHPKHEEMTVRSALSAMIEASKSRDPARMYTVLNHNHNGHPVIAHVIHRLSDWFSWARSVYDLDDPEAGDARAAGFGLADVDLSTIAARVGGELGPVQIVEVEEGRAGAGPLRIYRYGRIGEGRDAVLAYRRHRAVPFWRPEVSELLDREHDGHRDPIPLETGQRVLCPVGLAVVTSIADQMASLKIDHRPGVEWWATRSLQFVRSLGEVPSAPAPTGEEEAGAGSSPVESPQEMPAAKLDRALSGEKPAMRDLVSTYGNTGWLDDLDPAGKRLKIPCLVCASKIEKGQRFRAATFHGRGLRAHEECFEELAAACREAVAAEDQAEREAIQGVDG